MTSNTLPAYEPKAQPKPFCGYDKRVKAYGEPPIGYRWLKVGEKMPAESIYANHYDKKWLKMSYEDTVGEGHYALAAPIVPELIPADPSAAVALEVVGRNSKVVRFKIARQSDVVEYGRGFVASNGMRIESVAEPELIFSRSCPDGKFYLRGGTKRNDNVVLSCTPKRFERIVAALAEYNAGLTPKVEAPKPAPVSPEPPKYTGPEITYGHNLEDGINAAGPAPEGWRYLKMGEGIKDGDFRLCFREWQKYHPDWSAKKLTDWYWPVIRRVEPCSPPKSPESIIAERDAEIAALRAKVAEQEKSLAKIKAIVA